MRVILVMAMTLNGKIARTRHELVDWTPPEDKKIFANISKKAGVVIMGKRTYDTIGRPLPGRLNVVLTKSADRLQGIKGTLEFTKKPLSQLLRDLEKRGFREAALAGGSEVNAQFFKEGLISEIIVTIVPKIFGTGISLIAEVEGEADLFLKGVKKINDQSVALHYKVSA